MKRFTITHEGYNIEEVNRFIDVVIKRLEKLNNDNSLLQMKISSLEEELKKEQIYPNKIEGYNTEWILMDYGDIVVHIFTEKERQNYNIEELYERNM